MNEHDSKSGLFISKASSARSSPSELSDPHPSSSGDSGSSLDNEEDGHGFITESDSDDDHVRIQSKRQKNKRRLRKLRLFNFAKELMRKERLKRRQEEMEDRKVKVRTTLD